MARTIRDTYPEITIVPSKPFPHPPSAAMTRAEAEDARDEILELIKHHVDRSTRRHLDITTTLVESAICEHCNHTWTEEGTDYNGGCCGKDEANSPTRLAALQALSDEVETGDFYRLNEDGVRDGTRVAWPWTLASGVDKWLKAGRPADQIESLLKLCDRVQSSDWCTVWEDPGVYPFNAGGSPLPPRVEKAGGPDDLATEIRSLIEDMGLTPVRVAA